MQLISLSSNINGFDTLHFTNGLNILMPTSEVSKFYLKENYFLNLIHFCLGEHQINELEQHEGLIATLIFSNKNTINKIVRCLKNKKIIHFNEVEYRLNDFKKKIGEVFFNIQNDFNGLSFRSLIHFFIKRNLDLFAPYNYRFITNHHLLLNNYYLLGLDYLLETKIDELKKFEKEKKTILLNRKITLDKHFIDISKLKLEKNISDIEYNLANYNLTNYHSIKEQSDELKIQIESKQEELKYLKERIIFFKSRNRIEIRKEKIQKIYDDITLSIDDYNIKSFDKFENFIHQICINREVYLKKQIEEIEEQINNIKLKIKNYQQEQAKSIKFLGAKDTFDSFLKQAQLLAELKTKRHQYGEEDILLSEIKIIKLEISALEYQRANSNFREKLEYINKFYNNLMKELLPQVDEFIILKNNKLEIQGFNNISSNFSKSSNFLRSLCYDLTLLQLGSNHQINFIINANYKYCNLDNNTFKNVIQLLIRLFTSSEKQYILILEDNKFDQIENYIDSINLL